MPSTTPDEWHNSVVSNMSHASGAHTQAVANMAVSMSTIRSTNTEYGLQRDDVHGKFSQKIKNTEELRNQLKTRLLCNRKAAESSDWSLKKLKEAVHALAAPMELVNQRLAMREKRPKRERVYDGFQEALVNEGKELQAAKSVLINAIADTERHLKGLFQLRVELESDAHDKQHSLTVDMRCIDKALSPQTNFDKCYGRKSPTLKMVLPEVLGVPQNETNGLASERSRQNATLRCLQAATSAEEASKKRCQETSVLLLTTEKAVSTAFKATQAEMASRVQKTEALKQDLISQSKATDSKIAETLKCFKLIQEKLDFLEQPMSSNMRRSAARSGRTPRESITDQVSEALHAQHHALQGKKLQLQTQLTALESALAELDSSRRILFEDIADKDRALAIDRECAGCKNPAHMNYSFGHGKLGAGHRIFSDTASSKVRQVEVWRAETPR